MKPTELWKPLRAHFDAVLKTRGFERLKASPPAWTRPHDGLTQTVWFKSRAVGALGGEAAFTGALQRAATPAPGIEWKDGDFTSTRLFELFDATELEAARALHQRIESRRATTGPAFVAHDIWCYAASTDDVVAWAELLGGALVRRLETP